MLLGAYMLTKGLHVACALVSLLLFLWRGRLALRGHRIPQRWLRRVPDSVDTLLLITGVALMFITAQYPLVDDWMSLKLSGVVLYIVLGLVALRFEGGPRIRRAAFIAAILTFTGIVWLAHVRSLSA